MLLCVGVARNLWTLVVVT